MKLTTKIKRLHRRAAPPADECGASTIELVLFTPLLVLLGLFLMLCGRLVSVQLDVDAAAHAAVRAATLARTAPAARRDALTAARSTLTGSASCPQPAVTVDTSAFRPGGTITVTVDCRVPVRDLIRLSVGGSKRVTARATSPLDVYRGAA